MNIIDSNSFVRRNSKKDKNTSTIKVCAKELPASLVYLYMRVLVTSLLYSVHNTTTYISSDDIVIVPTASACIFPSACIA